MTRRTVSTAVRWVDLIARRSFVVVVCVCYALGCTSSARDVMVLLPSDAGVPRPDQVTLDAHPQTLEGGVVEMRTDATVDVAGDLASLSDEQRFNTIVKQKGYSPRPQYLERDQVLWPADFHSWNMTTAVYHFERAAAHFATLGAQREVASLRVFYWPRLRFNSSLPVTDNALYLSVIHSFVVLPFSSWQRVPLAMNGGIIGHEVAHRVFNERVFRGEAMPRPIYEWQGPGFNLLKSLDEGLADFHAVAMSCAEASGCQTAYLAASVADETVARARDVARSDACLTMPLKAAFQAFSPDQWVRDPSMYALGTLWAASLYQAGVETGQIEALERAVLAAYDDEVPEHFGLAQLSRAGAEAFTPERVADVIAAHLDDPRLRLRVCAQLLTRIQLACTPSPGGGCAELPHCPAGAQASVGACP